MSYILTAEQIALVKRIDTADSYLKINKLIADSYDPMKEEHLEFDANNLVLKALIPNKDSYAKTAIVLDQDQLKAMIAEDLEIIGHQVLAFAKKVKNKGLAKEFQFSKWSIESLNQPEVLPLVTNLVALINPFMTDPVFMKYKVTDADLTNITTNATTYDENIGVKGTTGNDLSTVNVNINKTLKLLTDNIHQMITLNFYFKKRNPDFYNGLIKNFRAQYAPSRATGLDGRVFGKDNKLLVNCLVRIVGTEFSVVTDKNGYFLLVGLTVGDYDLLACNESGDSQTLKVHVNYRHIETYDFHL